MESNMVCLSVSYSAVNIQKWLFSGIRREIMRVRMLMTNITRVFYVFLQLYTCNMQ